MKTHWHINTMHKPDTPPYPDKDAVHIYRTACAKELSSEYQDKEYKLTNFKSDIERVDCKVCKIWANAYFKQNISENGYYIYAKPSTKHLKL